MKPIIPSIILKYVYPEVRTALERVDAGCMTKEITMAVHICATSEILQKMRIRDQRKKSLMKMSRGSLSIAFGFFAHTEVIHEVPSDPKAHFWTPPCDPRNLGLRRSGLSSTVGASDFTGS